MSFTRNFRILTATAALTALAACGGDAAPDADGAAEGESGEVAAADGAGGELEGAIKERQANFEAIGDSFKAIRGQLEGGSPDMAAIGEAATTMNEKAVAVRAFFPAGSSVDDGFETEALATIWEKPEEFNAAHQKLVDATATMVTLAEGGDAAAIGAHVKELGGSCKGCHDEFRLDTD